MMLTLPYNSTHTVEGRVKHLRSLLLVHSYLYYTLDTPIVSDHKWQQWASELHDIQAVTPCNIDWYDNEFKDWNGSTGYHLPVDAFVKTVVKSLGL